MKFLLAGLALAFTLSGCAPVGGAPLLPTPAATGAAIRTESSAEVALNTAGDLWLQHQADLPAAVRAQVRPLAHRIPAVRKALRRAQALGQAASLQGQIAQAYGLATAIADAIHGALPATTSPAAAPTSPPT